MTMNCKSSPLAHKTWHFQIINFSVNSTCMEQKYLNFSLNLKMFLDFNNINGNENQIMLIRFQVFYFVKLKLCLVHFHETLGRRVLWTKSAINIPISEIQTLILLAGQVRLSLLNYNGQNWLLNFFSTQRYESVPL